MGATELLELDDVAIRSRGTLVAAILDEADAHDRDATVTRLCDATLVCVARFGLTKTTVEDIAQTAGLSRATVYRAIPGGRDALVARTLRRELGRFFRDLAAELDRHDDLEDQLVAALHSSMRFLAEHEALHTVVTDEPHLLLPQFAFHRLDPVLAFVREFARPHLEPHVASPAEAARLAEHLVRIVISYSLHPSPHLDPTDEASVRRLVVQHVLPGVCRRATTTQEHR